MFQLKTKLTFKKKNYKFARMDVRKTGCGRLKTEQRIKISLRMENVQRQKFGSLERFKGWQS